MEGLTDMVYRRTHRKYFPGVDRYYTPFVSPTQNHCFRSRELRELSPENNAGVPLVPQLIGKNAEDFLWAANELAQMGYNEVNLNLGCPSGTVTTKGKGAGFLAFPQELDRFLNEIFLHSPIDISIKTRLGIEDPEEFGAILEIYNRYPICELIIHPRTKCEMYTGTVHLDVFECAVSAVQTPLCYNGDITSVDRLQAFCQKFPTVPAVMIGRGLVTDPAMITRVKGYPQDAQALYGFHQELCEEYSRVFGSASSALPRMKAIWNLMLSVFPNGEVFRKPLSKVKKWPEFLAVTEAIFRATKNQ